VGNASLDYDTRRTPVVGLLELGSSANELRARETCPATVMVSGSAYAPQRVPQSTLDRAHRAISPHPALGRVTPDASLAAPNTGDHSQSAVCRLFTHAAAVDGVLRDESGDISRNRTSGNHSIHVTELGVFVQVNSCCSPGRQGAKKRLGEDSLWRILCAVKLIKEDCPPETHHHANLVLLDVRPGRRRQDPGL